MENYRVLDHSLQRYWAVMMTLQDVLSPDQAAIAAAVASGFYAVSRGLAKGGGV